MRSDEVAVVDRLVKEYGVKKHEVLKLAIRTFLFPREKEHIINGRKAIIEDLASFHMKGSDETFEQSNARIEKQLAKADLLAEKKIIIVPDKEKTFEIISDEEAERRKKKAELETEARSQ
jgi:hypothetical protein